MTQPKIDALLVLVYAAITIVMCSALMFLGWLAQRVVMVLWPWASAHANGIAAAVLTTCAIAVILMAVNEE